MAGCYHFCYEVPGRGEGEAEEEPQRSPRLGHQLYEGVDLLLALPDNLSGHIFFSSGVKY